MMDCPQNSNLIDIVEHNFCIYEQKYPILRGRLFVPNSLKPVDSAVNPCFKSGTYLSILQFHGIFLSCDL